MTKIATDLLLDIASEKNGFSIGDPWRFSEFSLAAVVPLLRDTEVERPYRLPSEVGKELKIKDLGSIDKVEITNRSEFDVLMKAGFVVVGATQSRALAVSQVIMAGERVEADCVCVYASKGIRAGQDVAVESYSPLPVRRAIRRSYSYTPGGFVNRGPHQRGASFRRAAFSYGRGTQSDVWGGVKSASKGYASAAQNLAQAVADGGGEIQTFGGFMTTVDRVDTSWLTPADDLAGRLAESRDKFKAALKETPHNERQVGMCLLALNGLESLECFEHPDSWKALRDSILESESDKIADITDQDSVFEFKADKAKAMIRQLLTTPFEESVAIDKDSTQTFILQSEKVTGEVVTLNSQPIHCAFMKKA
jgi:hypothetical protein